MEWIKGWLFPKENSELTEIENIFKDYSKDNEKFDEGIRNNKYGIIFIYDNSNNEKIINLFKEIKKDEELFNNIKNKFMTKVIDINNIQRINKYKKYIKDKVENMNNTIYFVEMKNQDYYLKIKCNMIFNEFKMEIEKIIKEKNEEQNNMNKTINDINSITNQYKNEEKKEQIFLQKTITSKTEEAIDKNYNVYDSNFNKNSSENNSTQLNDNNNINQLKESIIKKKEENILNNNNNLNDNIFKDLENSGNSLQENNNNNVNINYEISNNSEKNNEQKEIDEVNNISEEKLLNDKNSKKQILEEPKEDDNTTKIFFIFNNKKIYERNFYKNDKIQLMFDFLETKGINNIILSQTFPEKYYNNKNETFYNEGLYPDGYIKIINKQ